ISATFDSASFLSGAYKTLKSLFFPDPSTADLINQALQQIVREFRDARAMDLVGQVNGLADSYTDYWSTRMEGVPSNVLTDLNTCLRSMETLIAGPDARSACLVAEAYNLAIPLKATVKLQGALYQQLYGSEKPDWVLVHKQNHELFDAAVKMNTQLLGPSLFVGVSQLALWRYSQGKLSAGAASPQVVETVWSANERLRELLIPDYPAGWFTVRSAWSDTYLSGDPERGEVRGVSKALVDRNALWRLDHASARAVRVQHVSGLCLSVSPSGGYLIDPLSRVRLLPADAGGGEFDYQVFVVEQGGTPMHYCRRWHDGAWLKIGAAAVGVVGSAPAVFLNKAPTSAFHVELFASVRDWVRHYWRGTRDQAWQLGDKLGWQVRSAPAVFQNQARASEFNYEVFVVQDGSVYHYWRSWQDGRWRFATTVGANCMFAPAAFQNMLDGDAKFNYELFVVEGDHVQHYWRDWLDGKWHKGARFGSGVQSGPAAFMNQANGNFEVFVVENGKVQHYWRKPSESQWRKGSTFGTNVRSAPAVFQNCAPAARYNYELFVIEGSQAQHYWRGWQDGAWHTGARFGENAMLGVAAVQTVDFRDSQLWDWVDLTGDRRGPSMAVGVAPRGRLLLRSGDIWTKRRTHIGEHWDVADALVWEPSTLVSVVERCSLEPLTAPGCFLRHQNFRAKVSPVASDLDRQDATFRLMPGLTSGTALSFEAVNYRGYFLRHRNFELELAARGSDATFRADATFRRRPGLADPSLVSFESENYPGHFLRHRNALLYLERGEGSAFV
ncbi:MAG: AbfB domain-containing protein, partial [Syntrophales bacterium]